MSNIQIAVATFKEGFSCSQAVLSTCAPQLGLDRETALRVAGVFGGGMAHMGLTCGAVSGTLMVIGLRHGQTRAEDQQAKEKTYVLAREFVERFRSRNGSITCRELLGYDISTPEGIQLIREKGLFNSLCPKLVEDAIEIVEGLL